MMKTIIPGRDPLAARKVEIPSLVTIPDRPLLKTPCFGPSARKTLLPTPPDASSAMSHEHWELQCKVYIGGLGHSVDKISVEKACERYGHVRNLWIARNPPGFAFVEYADPRDADDAVKTMHGSEIAGRRVTVQKSTGKTRKDTKPWYKDEENNAYGYSAQERHRHRRSRSRSRSRSRMSSRSRSHRSWSRTRSRTWSRSRSRSRSYRRRRRSRSNSVRYNSRYRRRSGSSSSSSRRSHSTWVEKRRRTRTRSSSRHSSTSSRSRVSPRPRTYRKRLQDETPDEQRIARKARRAIQDRDIVPLAGQTFEHHGQTFEHHGQTFEHHGQTFEHHSYQDRTLPQDMIIPQFPTLAEPPDWSEGEEDAEFESDGNTRSIGVQTNYFLMLHFLEKNPDALNETFLRVERDKILNSGVLPEIIPTVHKQKIVMHTDRTNGRRKRARPTSKINKQDDALKNRKSPARDKSRDAKIQEQPKVEVDMKSSQEIVEPNNKKPVEKSNSVEREQDKDIISFKFDKSSKVAPISTKVDLEDSDDTMHTKERPDAKTSEKQTKQKWSAIGLNSKNKTDEPVSKKYEDKTKDGKNNTDSCNNNVSELSKQKGKHKVKDWIDRYMPNPDEKPDHKSKKKSQSHANQDSRVVKKKRQGTGATKFDRMRPMCDRDDEEEEDDNEHDHNSISSADVVMANVENIETVDKDRKTDA